MAQGMVFEDIFNVKDIDPNGKQFDRGKHNYLHIYYIIIMLVCLVHRYHIKFSLYGYLVIAS